MSTFGKPSQNPGENIELTKKISEITETIPLTEQQVEEFKDVELNHIQISKLKQGKFTLAELTKLKLEQLKSTTTEYSAEQLKSRLNEGAEKAKESYESAEVYMNKSMEKIGNSETGIVAKETLEKAKEKAIELGSEDFFDHFINTIKSSFGKLGEMFAGILSFFKGFFSFGNKIEEIKKKLSPKKMEETKNKIITISDNLVEKFDKKTDGKLLKQNKQELERLIQDPNFLDEHQLAIINEKIESGEFQLSDLSSIVSVKDYKKLHSTIFTEEQIEFLKNDTINQFMEIIAEEYSIDLRKLSNEDKEKFRKTVLNNNINEDFIKVAESYDKGEFISLADLLKTGLLTVTNGFELAFALIDLIPFVNLGGNIAKGATDILELATGSELEQNIILEKLESLTPEQKNIVFGIMLRKGMFISNLIQGIMFSLTRTVVETMIGGNKGNSLSNAKAIGTNNFSKQITMLESLSNSLGQKESEVGKGITFTIDKLNTATKKGKEILKTLDIIKKSKEGGINIQTEIQKLAQNGNTVANELSGLNSTTEIKSKLSTIIGNSFSELNVSTTGIFANMTENKLGFGKNSQLYKIIESQEVALKYYGEEWKRYLDTGDLGKYKIWKKWGALSESIRFTQNNRNIEIHATSLKDGAEKLDHLKQIGQHLPQLVGGATGIAGITLLYSAATNKEETESFLDTVVPNLKYLIPTWGPLTVLLNDTGIQKNDNFRDSIKVGLETSSMLMFLAMDGGYISKEFINGWSNGTMKNSLKNIGNYHIQILKSPLETAKAIKNISVSGYNMIKSEGKINKPNLSFNNPKELAKEFGKKVMSFKPTNVYTFLLYMGLAGITISTLMDTSQEKIFKEYKEKGYITDDGYNFQLLSEKATTEEKTNIIKMLILENKGISDINISLVGDKLYIVSNNKNIKHIESLLTTNELKQLKDIGVDTTNKGSISFEYIQKQV